MACHCCGRVGVEAALGRVGGGAPKASHRLKPQAAGLGRCLQKGLQKWQKYSARELIGGFLRAEQKMQSKCTKFCADSEKIFAEKSSHYLRGTVFDFKSVRARSQSTSFLYHSKIRRFLHLEFVLSNRLVRFLEKRGSSAGAASLPALIHGLS